MSLGGFQCFDQPNRAEFRTVGGLGALLGGILQPEVDRIDLQLLGDLVDHAFDRIFGNRRAWRPVGRNFRPVCDDIEADRLDVLQIIGRERAHRSRPHRAALERARLIVEFALACGDAAVVGGADLDAHMGAGSRA